MINAILKTARSGRFNVSRPNRGRPMNDGGQNQGIITGWIKCNISILELGASGQRISTEPKGIHRGLM